MKVMKQKHGGSRGNDSYLEPGVFHSGNRAGCRCRCFQRGAGLSTTSDAVNPKHYAEREIQSIEVIEAWELGFNTGNAIKYIARHKHKGSEHSDLIKAANYLYREATGRWLPEDLL